MFSFPKGILLADLGIVLPGQGRILLPPTREVEVQIEALSSRSLEKIEILVDGQIVASFHPTARAFMTSVRAQVGDGGWLAVRAFEEHPRTVRFAHTSPFYIGAKPHRNRDAVDYLKVWIEDEIARLELAGGLTSEQREGLIGTCRRALARLE